MGAERGADEPPALDRGAGAGVEVAVGVGVTGVSPSLQPSFGANEPSGQLVGLRVVPTGEGDVYVLPARHDEHHNGEEISGLLLSPLGDVYRRNTGCVHALYPAEEVMTARTYPSSPRIW